MSSTSQARAILWNDQQSHRKKMLHPTKMLPAHWKHFRVSERLIFWICLEFNVDILEMIFDNYQDQLKARVQNPYFLTFAAR